MTTASCSNCGFDFSDADQHDRRPCPQCGSMNRSIAVSLVASVRATSSISAVLTTNPPLFSFGAIVTAQRRTEDGDVIKLVDPFYAKLLEEIQRDPNIMYHLDPRKWEEIIAGAYDKAGFDEVILTPRSGDLGRDVIAIKHGFGSIKFIEQVKAYHQGHTVTADEVRALLGVLQAEQNASKAVFTTTSTFAPRIETDKLIKPFLPYRLELIDRIKLLERLEKIK